MAWMTPKEYAEYRAVSPQIINRHIKTGKIPARATKPAKPGSKRKLINSRLADRALKDGLISNYNETGKRKPKKVSKKGGNGAGKRNDIDNDRILDAIAAADLDENTTAADAQRLKTIYEAALKKQTLDKNAGELVDAKDVTQAYAKVVTAAKTKFLSVQSKVAPLINDAIDDPAAASEIIKVIGDLHREALQDLAGGKRT